MIVHRYGSCFIVSYVIKYINAASKKSFHHFPYCSNGGPINYVQLFEIIRCAKCSLTDGYIAIIIIWFLMPRCITPSPSLLLCVQKFLVSFDSNFLSAKDLTLHATER